MIKTARNAAMITAALIALTIAPHSDADASAPSFRPLHAQPYSSARHCQPITRGREHDAAYAQLIRTGDYLPSMGGYLGSEDSDQVDRALVHHERRYLHIRSQINPSASRTCR